MNEEQTLYYETGTKGSFALLKILAYCAEDDRPLTLVVTMTMYTSCWPAEFPQIIVEVLDSADCKRDIMGR